MTKLVFEVTVQMKTAHLSTFDSLNSEKNYFIHAHFPL